MLNHSLTPEILVQSNALPVIRNFLEPAQAQLRRNKRVPEHIVEDLTFLQRKWERGDLGILALRGLRQVGPYAQLFVDPDWPYALSADFYGDGHLVNGQTWAYRAEMMRDGAHSAPIAGICGKKAKGARSIVMGYHDEVKKDYYADIDIGDGSTIYYYGTALPRRPGDNELTNEKDPRTYRAERITRNSRGEGPTSATEALFESYRTRRPVRVFRSFRLAEIVEHKPLEGFRYDGLYTVVAPELVKRERQIYRFKMERIPGQGPLRHHTANIPRAYRGIGRKRCRED
jgi:hypothetical protein